MINAYIKSEQINHTRQSDQNCKIPILIPKKFDFYLLLLKFLNFLKILTVLTNNSNEYHKNLNDTEVLVVLAVVVAYSYK